MMRRKTVALIFILFILLENINIQAQGVSVTLNVATAGTLNTLIDPSQKNLITNLTLTGDLNGTDILYIREMAGRDVNGNATSGRLSVIDLSGANIVSGGSAYYRSDCYTSANSISKYMFYGLYKLTSITIPSSVTTVGDNAFSGCTGLTSMILPGGVISIKIYAFSGCTGLTSITIPSSVTSIEGCAFSGCTGLTSLTIPSSVTSIGVNAFSECTGLTSITVPSGVTSIEKETFSNCTGLTSITIGSSVTSIGEFAFYRCNRLTSITIPSSVTSIGSKAFYDCRGLTSVTIPVGVTSIGIQAFFYCSGLTSVTIGSSVTSIGDKAFYGCTGLTDIHCQITVPPSISSDVFANVNKTICKLYIPENSYSTYSKTLEWKDFTNIVEVNSQGVVIHTITTNCNEGGCTTINELNKIATTIEEGKSATIIFLPNEGYILTTVLLNGNDITANISNNSYIIPSVTQNQVFNVTFKKIALATTVTAGEGGQASLSSQSVDYGNSVTLTITPDEGYVVDKVTKNGTDITDSIANSEYTATAIKENIEFVVIFKMYTDISQVQRKNIKVYTDQDAIVVSGIDLGNNISVYTCSGFLLQIIKATDNMVRINLPPNHIYLVNIADKTFKVAL